ncbi:hypothetical protein NL676_011968 [Syzygium grande]|nr:hypothetical protein NL676_011968 [Syzygium grande]
MLKFRYLLSTAAAPVLMRAVIQICKYVMSKLSNKERESGVVHKGSFPSPCSTTKEENNPDEVRNYLLVVATLIAAVTLQAGTKPPCRVWHEDMDNHKGFPFFLEVVVATVSMLMTCGALIFAMPMEKVKFR